MNFALRHEAHDHSGHAAPRLARIEVLRRFEDAEKTWRALDAAGAIHSPYQGFDWVTLWHRHVTRLRGAAPLVVIGYDNHDYPLFLWPLVLQHRGPLAFATYVGGKHSTLNLPVWRPDYANRVTAFELNLILDQIARRLPELDLLVLLSQPTAWNGLANPLTILPHQQASDDTYRLNLVASPDPASSNISQGMRRRLRKKENQLAKLPGYRGLPH